MHHQLLDYASLLLNTCCQTHSVAARCSGSQALYSVRVILKAHTCVSAQPWSPTYRTAGLRPAPTTTHCVSWQDTLLRQLKNAHTWPNTILLITHSSQCCQCIGHMTHPRGVLPITIVLLLYSFKCTAATRKLVYHCTPRRKAKANPLPISSSTAVHSALKKYASCLGSSVHHTTST